MKLFILAITLFFSSQVLAVAITKRCVSESGMSVYDLNFDVTKGTGEIRYQYRGQDVFYDAHIQNNESDVLKGIAVFKKSNSGETKANPFNFTYDKNKNTFTELNVTANCD